MDPTQLIADIQLLITDVTTGHPWLALSQLLSVIKDIGTILAGRGMSRQAVAALSAKTFTSKEEAVAALQTELGASSINWSNVLAIVLALAKLMFPMIFA